MTYRGYKKVRALAAAIRAIQCGTWISSTLTEVHSSSNSSKHRNATNTVEDAPFLPLKEASSTSLPMYFMSDSEQLVQSVLETTVPQTHNSQTTLQTQEPKITTATNTNTNTNTNTTSTPRMAQVESQLRTVTQTVAIRGISRTEHPIRHINDGGTHGFSMESYPSTFVDLYLAANARCIVWGVGNFAIPEKRAQILQVLVRF